MDWCYPPRPSYKAPSIMDPRWQEEDPRSASSPNQSIITSVIEISRSVIVILMTNRMSPAVEFHSANLVGTPSTSLSQTTDVAQIFETDRKRSKRDFFAAHYVDTSRVIHRLAFVQKYTSIFASLSARVVRSLPQFYVHNAAIRAINKTAPLPPVPIRFTAGGGKKNQSFVYSLVESKRCLYAVSRPTRMFEAKRAVHPCTDATTGRN